MEYVYIIVYAFVNTQSMLNILTSKGNVFNCLRVCKTLQQCLSHEGQIIIRGFFTHVFICHNVVSTFILRVKKTKHMT